MLNNLNAMPPKSDLLDCIIAINIILFIVSVIVEKITNLIRHYAPFRKPGKRINLWQNISKTQTGRSRSLDKVIEREVNSLSFMIGLVIVVIFRVDLFKMFSSQDPRQVLMWSDAVKYSPLDMVLFFFSIPLTAFFLTFGSKFFHDLLDMLMQVKNLKRKLVDPNTYNADNIGQFDNYLKQGYNDMIDAAIKQNAATFQGAPLLYPPLHGRMMQGGQLVDCIEVHLSSDSQGSLPASVNVTLTGTQPVTIPLKIVTGVTAPKALAGQGGRIASSLSPTFIGTIGCKIQRGSKKEYLTCSHVFTGGNPVNYFGEIDDVPGIVDGAAEGNFDYSQLTDSLDMALLRIDEDEPFSYQINPQPPRALSSHDIMTTTIRVSRNNGDTPSGKVTNNCMNNDIPITYDNGTVKNMSKLIILSNVGNQNDIDTYVTLTQKGDSGALVYDDSDRPVGMIVAGNNRFSYAVDITTLLSTINATITT